VFCGQGAQCRPGQSRGRDRDASESGRQGCAAPRSSRILIETDPIGQPSPRRPGVAATLVAAVRTVLACGTVATYVFLAGPPALLWTLLTRRTELLYATAGFGVRLGFILAGIDVRVLGREHLQTTGAVYASNHSSNVDSPAMFWSLRSLFPRVRVLYKAELRKLPVLVWAFDLAGFVPLERANRRQSWPAVERAAQAIAQGYSFFIFPEGTRSRTGELLPFKKGGFIMAIKACTRGARGRQRRARSQRKGSHSSGRRGDRPLLPPVPTVGVTSTTDHGCIGSRGDFA
jgi:1-acyl-sn-glycerol-3-phosphate acyltransferase